MKTGHLILALLFSSAMLWTDAYAANTTKTACHFEKIELTCAEFSPSGSAVLTAMAHPESLHLLSSLKTKPHVYMSRAERETFRKSLEKNRKIARNYADQSLRRLKAKLLDEQSYAQVRTEFRAAMDTYWAGMAHYWSESWYSVER